MSWVGSLVISELILCGSFSKTPICYPAPFLGCSCGMLAQAGSDCTRHVVTRKLVLMSRSVPGDVSVGIKCDARVLSDDEEDVDFDIIHNANDTFTVKYVPPAPGRYTIKVLFASEVCRGPPGAEWSEPCVYLRSGLLLIV